MGPPVRGRACPLHPRNQGTERRTQGAQGGREEWGRASVGVNGTNRCTRITAYYVMVTTSPTDDHHTHTQAAGVARCICTCTRESGRTERQEGDDPPRAAPAWSRVGWSVRGGGELELGERIRKEEIKDVHNQGQTRTAEKQCDSF